jgi:hypothetical protein
MGRKREITRRDRSNERRIARIADKQAKADQREREAFQREFAAQLRKLTASGKAKVTVNTDV